MTPEDVLTALEGEAIRDGSPLMAFLFVVHKAHRELVGAVPALARFRQVHTRGHARHYLEEIMPLLLAHRRERRHKSGR